MTYTNEELERMLDEIESDLSERKESFAGDVRTAAREAVCAFANDLPNHGRPGALFIGAKDDGAPSGLPITDQLLQQLADIKTDGAITPPPSMTVSKRSLRGADMAVVIVEPSDSPPVRFKGRVYIRIGPRRGIASAQDERILNEKRRYRDIPFDIQPVSSATLADLNRLLFEEEYLPSSLPPDLLESDERTYEQRLVSAKMITPDDGTPTVLGLLVLGVTTRDFLPGAYIQFVRIDGEEITDPITDEQEVDGGVTDVLRRIDEKLTAHTTIAVEFTTGTVETRRASYPIVALQQIVRNAVMHRTYEATNAPVRVYWYDDRIEISNPGGPYGVVNAANFGAPGLTDYRNPNLAEALKNLGFVQHFGAGIPQARRALAQNGNPPPSFAIESTYIGVTLRLRP